MAALVATSMTVTSSERSLVAGAKGAGVREGGEGKEGEQDEDGGHKQGTPAWTRMVLGMWALTLALVTASSGGSSGDSLARRATS